MKKEDLQKLLSQVAQTRVPVGTVFEREIDFGGTIGKQIQKFRRLPYLEMQALRERGEIEDTKDPAQVEKAKAVRRRSPIIQIAAMLVDDDGRPMVTEAEVEKWDPILIDRHYLACLDINVQTEEARAEVAKKSEPTQSAAS